MSFLRLFELSIGGAIVVEWWRDVAVVAGWNECEGGWGEDQGCDECAAHLEVWCGAVMAC